MRQPPDLLLKGPPEDVLQGVVVHVPRPPIAHMKLPGQLLEGMQVQPKRTHLRLGPVNDAHEVEGVFVDHDVEGAKVLVEQNHGQGQDGIEGVDAPLHNGLELGWQRGV